jgi:uncharacterized protein (DUF427 family)
MPTVAIGRQSERSRGTTGASGVDSLGGTEPQAVATTPAVGVIWSTVLPVAFRVMTPGHTITIVPTTAHVEVRLGGRVLATTNRAMKLAETGLPSRYYLLPDDVQMDLLRATTFHTTCPFKGEASYWSVDIDGEIHDGIVWSYETPTAQAAEVRGMLSFYPDRTEVTVDGQLLRD